MLLISILRRVKEQAFSKGLPIYYGKDGKVVAEYADGRITSSATAIALVDFSI